MEVSAAIFSDGHDHVAAQLLYRHEQDADWTVAALASLPNDFWTGEFAVDRLGRWEFTLRGWVDHFDTWSADLRKRLAAQAIPEPQTVTRDPAVSNAANPDAANPQTAAAVTTPQDIAVALAIGVALVEAAAKRAPRPDGAAFRQIAVSLQKIADTGAPTLRVPTDAENKRN